jgi:LPS-assembly protein
MFSPVAALVAAHTGQNPQTIPNEDSLAFDYSDTDLFVPNRFAGLDQVDGGQRIDYGLRAAIYGEDAQSVSMLIGQSRRFDNVGFPQGSGLENKISDIVGRFIITPVPDFSAIYRYRLSEGNLRPVRQEVGVVGGPPNLRSSISYIKLPPDLVASDPGNRDQIAVGTTVGLSRYWTLNFATTRNLTGNLGTVSSSVRATYQDECLAFITTLSQSGISDRDIKPGASIVFTLVFKNLGEINLPSIATQGIQ